MALNKHISPIGAGSKKKRAFWLEEVKCFECIR
jgi:hypothetical protein